MRFGLYLLLSFISCTTSFHLSEFPDFCGSNRVCYSYPKNCNTEECSIVMSLGEQITQIYVSNFEFAQSFLVYTINDGTTQEEMFVCYAGVDNCYYGHQTASEPVVLTKQQRTSMSVIEDGKYTYTFMRALLKTGQSIEYMFKKVSAGGDPWSVEMEPLHYLTGNVWSVDLKRADEETEVTKVETILENFVDIKSNEVDSRPRRVVEETGMKRITLDELMNFVNLD